MDSPWRVEVFYDGDCPLCLKEIQMIQWMDRKKNRIRFTDIAAEDFDAARLMGVRSDRIIRGAFALSGVLAGVAAVFWLMRSGQAGPTAGLTPMLKGVLAALIGGLGSLGGAVLGGVTLGLVEVMLISRLPEGLVGLTDGIVFLLIAFLFVFRPQGFISVRRAERV